MTVLLAIDFAAPAWSWGLAVVLAGSWFLHRDLTSRRRRIGLVLRALVLAALVLALARPRIVDEVDDLAVAFVLDVSKSVPAAERDRALDWIERQFERVPDGDRVALLIFGERTSVELPFGGRRTRADDAGFAARLHGLESRVRETGTDIGAALEFTEGTFPPDMARRIVLLSDGNETRGDVEQAAFAIRSADVRLDVVPLRYDYEDEVVVEGLHAAQTALVDEPLQLRCIISSRARTTAELELFENGVSVSESFVVDLQRGTNAFRFSRTPSQSGHAELEVVVRPQRDGNVANNVGRASVIVGGGGRVVVSAPPDHDSRLVEVLRQNGIPTDAVAPSALPANPAGYIGTQVIVFDNLPAFQLEEAQLTAVRDGIKELGVGAVFIGGDRAFGPGGYRGTPLEALLPVDLDVKNRRTLPKGALVVVLHSIEFDSGNTWAARICTSALRGLSPDDEAGVVYYSNGGETWLFDLQPLGDAARLAPLIDTVSVGDMPSFHRCFVLAEQSLARSDAAVKHIVVISDGDPTPPDNALLARLVASRVTISTICIDPHSATSLPTMKSMAEFGRGRFIQLYPRLGDLNRLPNLLLKEAATLRRNAIVERPFVPVIALGGSPLIKGVGAAWPRLGGYVVTAPRGGAETILLADEKEGDPLLAAWYQGTGRVVAFTSDASSRWAGEWLGWSKFGPLWSQIVRSAMPRIVGVGTSGTVRQEGSGLVFGLALEEPDGTPRTAADVRATLLAAAAEPRKLEVRQIAPGAYEARADDLEPGHYLVRFDHGDAAGEPRYTLVPAAVDFSPEHRAYETDVGVLARTAAAAGGALADFDVDPFRHDFSAVRGRSELWPVLVVTAAVLLLLELLVRRLDVSPAGLFRRRAPAPREVRSAARQAADHAPARSAPGWTPELDEKKPEADAPPPKEPKTKTADADTLEALRRAKERAERRREWR